MVASRLLICIPSDTLALSKPADSREHEYLDVFFLMEKQPKSIGNGNIDMVVLCFFKISGYGLLLIVALVEHHCAQDDLWSK